MQMRSPMVACMSGPPSWERCPQAGSTSLGVRRRDVTGLSRNLCDEGGPGPGARPGTKAVPAFPSTPSVSSIQGGGGTRVDTLGNWPIANCYYVQMRIVLSNLLTTIDTP